MPATDELRTIGQIAKAEGIPTHRVGYAVDTYGIEPTCRVGILRVFDLRKQQLVRAALKQIADRRRGRPDD